LAAIDAWQTEVGYEYVKRKLAQQFNGPLPRIRLGDVIAVLDQALRQHRSQRRLVVHK
jgi:hypothetical protein